MSEEKKYCVYCHTSPSGKVYIGMTGQNVERRWRKGGAGYKECTYFWRAIQKYGWDNFKHEILFDNLTKEDACEIEYLLILLFDTQNKEVGYNVGSGGGCPMAGRTLSEETKKKISQSMIGKNAGENNYWYGKHLSEEVRKKMSASLTGRTRQPHSEEAKAKIRQAAIERFNGKNGEEERRKLSEAMKRNKNALGYCHTEESKRKMSEAQLKRYSKERNSDKTKKTLNNRKRIAIVCAETGKLYESISAAAKELGLDKANIRACLLNSNRTCGKLHWRYATEEEIKNVQNSSI